MITPNRRFHVEVSGDILLESNKNRLLVMTTNKKSLNLNR